MAITSRVQRSKVASSSSTWTGGDFQCVKLGFFAIAALILAGFGGWIASTSQARVAAPMDGISIDPMQMMTAAPHLPTQHVVDYSLVYE